METCLLSAFVALAFNLLTAAPSPAVAAEPPPEWDGLLRVPDKGADHLYLLRGADLGIYTKVLVSPVQVTFDPDWKSNSQTRNPERFVSSADMDQIRSGLAREFHTIFESELTKGGYTLSPQGGDEVLSISPAIVNLHITAPKTQTSGRSRRYVADTGRMTLVLELRDSVSGQLLGRVVDTQHGRRDGRLVLATPLTNLTDARESLSNWARMTLTALDYAKQSSPETAVARKPNGSAEPR